MPNVIPAPLVLPDPNELGAGRQLTATPVDQLLGTMNWCHAEGHAKGVVLQEWGDALCSTTGAAFVNGVCEWPIPVLSAAHLQVEVRVEAFSTGAVAGTVRFNSAVAGASINAAVPVGGAAWVNVGLLTVTGGPATEEFVTMDLAGGGAADSIQIERVLIRYVQLVSPLAAAKVGAFTPFGTAYGVADESLPSYVGKTVVEGLGDLLARRRSIAAWSGLIGLGGATSPSITESSRITTTPYSRGAGARGVTMRLLAKVSENVLSPTYIRPGFLIDGVWTWWGGQQAVVPAGIAPAAWYSVDFTPPEVPAVRAMPHLLVRMRPWVVDDAGTPRPAQVFGYSIHGV